MILPRPYQTEAIDALNNHLCTKANNPCVVIPTGGGKSICIALSILKWKKDYDKFRCVILAHRKELVLQNATELWNIYCQEGLKLSSEIGIFSAAMKRRDYYSSILFASIDSIYKKAGEFPPFDLIMVDEAHRIPFSGEGKYRTFLKECGRFNKNLRIVGWTATPFRMNGGPICHKDHLLNEICYGVKLTNLIKDGYLCNLRSKVGSVVLNLDGVKKQGGEYVTSSLSKATNKRDIVARAIREAVAIINTEQRNHIVFFCVDVEHCHAVSNELQLHGIYAPAITGKTRLEIRDKVGEDFKNGKLRAVCNVNVYTEGFNATCADCIVLLRPTLSPGLFFQMVGRGLRIHSNKHFCLILDFANCIEEHGPIDLLGEDGKVRLAICTKCREVFSRAIRICPECGWELPKREFDKLERIEAERRMHGDKISGKEILSSIPEVYKVADVVIGRHCKDGSPDSLVVRYICGLRIFREWICLDHEGYAGKRAQDWWQTRFGTCKKRVTVNDALENFLTVHTVKEFTKTITVRRKGKYFEVIGHNSSLPK